MAIRTEDHSDLKKFGNRLWYVMTGKGYTTPRALATSLYDQQLVSADEYDKVRQKMDQAKEELAASQDNLQVVESEEEEMVSSKPYSSSEVNL